MTPDQKLSTEMPSSLENRLILLASEIGFKETKEMVDLRQKIEAKDLKASMATYQYLAGVEIDKHGQTRQRDIASIGLIVVSAALCHKLGALEGYQDAIDTAIFCAENIDDEDLANKIRAIKI